MLDIKFIRDNTKIVREELKKRGMHFDMDAFLELDTQRRKLVQVLDESRAKQNEVSDKITNLAGDERTHMIEEMKKLKEYISTQEKERVDIEKEWNAQLLYLPNISHESVPVGSDESGNVVVKTWGEPRQFDFKPLEHYQIPSVQPYLDMERGAKIAGNRFWYLKGPLAQLEMGLMQYAMHFFSDKGFIPMITPMLVREEALWGTGFFPADKNEIYTVNKDEDNLYLVGTAEVPLAGYYMDETIDLSDGPQKFVGYSSCFRREAGAYGKDMKGMLRGHQFNKAEMFIFCSEEDSWPMHEFLRECAESFMQSLNLPYRVLNMCTGDIGAPNAKKYDIETWMPGQGQYRETNSCSNDTEFQARRLN
ncbi:MAG: serine--tRNA ligase, partial [bacterium]|nr:serine--tRNA ligase [bacterium]